MTTKSLAPDEIEMLTAIWTAKGSGAIRKLMTRLDRDLPKRPSWDGFAADWSGDVSIKEMAQLYGRSERAIRDHARKLNLPKRGADPKLPQKEATDTVSPGTITLQAHEPVTALSDTFSTDKWPQPGKCTWPIGTPGHDDFKFCGDTVSPARPYCPQHAKLAYIKLREDD